MKKNCFPAVILSVFAAVLLAGCYCRQNVFTENRTDFAAEALSPYVESGEIPGFINIFYKNGVQETTCKGWADVEKKIPISIDQLFLQCSQTKGFCGITVAMLIEDGKLSLDDPVYKYLPEFKNLKVYVNGKNDKDGIVPAEKVLTVRMVMNHTGGFGFEIPSKMKKGLSSVSLRETAREAAALPLLFEPGTKTYYSNAGIDIGAAVVEVISGKKWDVFLKERLFDRLDMKTATFYPTKKQLAERIFLYNCQKDKKAELNISDLKTILPPEGKTIHPAASGTLWLSAADQYKFYKMLMNRGVGDNGVRILREDTFKTLLASSSRPPEMGRYSLGLYADIKDGTIGHSGAWNTLATVNWKKRELSIFIVQIIGSRFWKNSLEDAAGKFFSAAADNSAIYNTGGMQQVMP